MQQPAMDTQAFAAMKDLMGDSFQDIIALTLSSLPEQLSLLEQAIDAKDAEQIFNVAHRIKSSSSTIGALGLAASAEAIELIGRSGSASVKPQLFTSLESSISEVIAILKAESAN